MPVSPYFLWVLALCAMLAIGGGALGEEKGTQSQSLGQAASDPTASLMSFQLQDFYSPTLHNRSGSQNILQFRSAIPFEAFGLNHIARVTVPVITHSANTDAGLADMTLFDLVTFDRSWGRFGVGAVALLPTGGSKRGSEKWAVGPAAGFVARPKGFLVGMFNQNLLSFAGDDNRGDISLSTMQPILSVSLGDGWSAGASDMTFVYDWEKSELTSIPFGLKLSKLVKVKGLPIQMQLSYERNFYDEGFGPQDTLGMTFKLLLPK